MSIKIRVPLTPDDLETGDVHEIDILKLLDPRVNKICFTKFQLSQWVDYLKLVYTRENLEAAAEQLLRGHKPNRNRLIDLIPDEDLFKLPFVYAAIDPDWAGAWVLYIYNPASGLVEATRGCSTENFKEDFKKAVRCYEISHELFDYRWSMHQLPFIELLTRLWIDDYTWSEQPQNRNLKRASAIRALENEGAELVTQSLYALAKIQKFVTSADRTLIEKLLSYTANPMDYIRSDLKRSPLTPLLGVELEFSTNLSVKDLVAAQETPFAIYKQDNSVSGSKAHSVEMVTIPMTFDAHRTAWASWFGNIPLKEFDKTLKTTNGMHVHIDKREFDNSAFLRRFCWFFSHPGNTNFFLTVSERSKTSFSQYARMPTFNKKTTIAGAIKEAPSKIQCGQRGIIAVSSKPTIEVRLFKGVVSFAALLKNLEFVMAALEFCRSASLKALTASDFCKWLESQPANRFTTLKAFLKANTTAIKEACFTSELLTHIFLEDEPESIISILKDKNIPHTQAIQRALNKITGRNTFEFDNGKIVVNTRGTLSSVASLDTSLIKRYSNKQKGCA